MTILHINPDSTMHTVPYYVIGAFVTTAKK